MFCKMSYYTEKIRIYEKRFTGTMNKKMKKFDSYSKNDNSPLIINKT